MTAELDLYLARPHVRHPEWAEEDHLKSAARFCWWGRTLPHDGSPPSGARVERGWSEGGGNNDTRPLRSHAARAPPGQALGSRQLSLAPAPSEPFAASPTRRKPPPRRLMGAGRLWREQPQPFRRLQNVSSLPACGIHSQSKLPGMRLPDFVSPTQLPHDPSGEAVASCRAVSLGVESLGDLRVDVRAAERPDPFQHGWDHCDAGRVVTVHPSGLDHSRSPLKR